MIRRVFFIGLLFIFLRPVNLDAKTVYEIKAGIDYDNFQLEGISKINFTNTSLKALDSIYLLLYPNVHMKESDLLTDINYDWIFPDDFSKGWLKVNSVKVSGNAVNFSYQDDKRLPESTLMKVVIPKSVGPEESVDIEVEFIVQIPHKFGPFGRYRRDILLNGGFYPYVPTLLQDGTWEFHSYPESSNFNLTLKGAGKFLVNGIEVQEIDDSEEALNIGFSDIDYLTLYNTNKMIVKTIKGKRIGVKLYFHRNEIESEKPLLRDAKRFIDYVESLDEFKEFNQDIILCESYLRDRLIQPSDGVVYFSDRTHKLFAPLRTYHSLEIIRGLFYELLRSNVRSKERAKDYDWVVNTLTRYYVERYLKERHRKLRRDARKLGIVRLFSFLPELDQVIYAPQFPFTSVYYDKIYTYDYFRLDILDYNRQIRSKRILYEKLKDKYADTRDFDRFFVSYIKGDKNFKKLAARNFGEGSKDIFKWWLGPYPSVNYGLVDIKREKKEINGWGNTITLKKETDSDLEEPVLIYLKEYGGKNLGKKHFVKWNPTKAEEKLKIDTEKRLRTVHIDPGGRLYEYKLSDNRSPALYKWILTSYSLGLDVNSSAVHFALSTTFRRVYGSNNRYTFSGYTDQATYGGSVGYMRLFGRLLDQLRLSHGIALSYRFDGLKSDYIVYLNQNDDPSAGTYQEIALSPSGRTSMLYLQYFFGNVLSYENPKSGMSAAIYGGLASKYLGGDFNFYKLGITWSGIVSINRSNFFALRGIFAVSGKNDIPPQHQYYLGGLYSMKGFPQGEISRVGRNKILLSAEYRHYLFKDIDVNFFWLVRVRNIMGAAFVDVGRVSATVLEFAEHVAYGRKFSTSPHNLFNIKEYDADFGYGIRFIYDILGIKESVLSIDVAKSATDFHAYGVRFYVFFAQSF